MTAARSLWRICDLRQAIERGRFLRIETFFATIGECLQRVKTSRSGNGRFSGEWPNTSFVGAKKGCLM
jgi:hypothetical protein